MPTDLFYMQRALELAEKGKGWTSPNPLVGAVLVKNGTVVGEGYHKAYGQPHAELAAINAAGAKAQDATLYVNLEPCNHHGKTPPCTNAIIDAQIKRVVIAMQDPNHVARGGVDILRKAGIKVEVGVMENAARNLNRFFIKYVTQRKPYVIAKCAMTLDGKIATPAGDSKWISNEASRAKAHELRHEAAAILVGAGTIKADNPCLTTRVGDNPHDPVRLVLAPHANVDPAAHVFSVKSTAPAYLVTSNSINADKLKVYTAKGIPIIALPNNDGWLDLSALMDILYTKQIASLLVEGGSATIGGFFKADLVDECKFFVAPKILGGDGITPTSGLAPQTIADALQFGATECELIGGDVLITCYRKLL